jgi:hypothetical protein
MKNPWKMMVYGNNIIYLVGGLEHEWIMTFPPYWEFHDTPN